MNDPHLTWCAPDVLVDDLRAIADATTLDLSRRQRRRLLRAARDIERTTADEAA